MTKNRCRRGAIHDFQRFKVYYHIKIRTHEMHMRRVVIFLPQRDPEV